MNSISTGWIVTTLVAIAMTSASPADSPVVNRRVVAVEAKPAAITIDTATTAVILVDMQNDFLSKGGMFDRCKADMSAVQKVIVPTAKVLIAARRAGIKIIYLKMGFRPDLSDLGALGSVSRVRYMEAGVGQAVRAPDGRESRILIRDTWNTDIVDELKPEPDDVVIYKTRYSGFHETELDAILKKAGIKHLVVVGCTTSVCVDSTVRDAMFRDYSCVSLSDCMGEPLGEIAHNASLAVMEVALGWVSDSNHFLHALKLPPSSGNDTQ